MIRFEAVLCRPADGSAWRFLRLPGAASEQLSSRGLVSVEGTMNGTAFQVTLQPDGAGGHWMKVEPDLCEGAGVVAGDLVSLEILPVEVEPEPVVPDDLLAALSETPEAGAVWAAITPVARRDWIHWMTSGKRAETRSLRREKMIDMLAKGKRRICCFDRSGMYSKSLSCPEAVDEGIPG